MRRQFFLALALFSFAAVFSATAATGRVVKVLPLFLDQQGRHALSPSLFDRDAYQAQLRKNPEQRTAMRFDVLWRVRGEASGKLKLRLELRGMAHGNLPQEKTLETEVSATGLNRWSSIKLGGDDYKNFGEVTAWRVTLWDGDQQLGEQKSFLW